MGMDVYGKKPTAEEGKYLKSAHNKKLTLREYNAELERRRQIGSRLTLLLPRPRSGGRMTLTPITSSMNIITQDASVGSDLPAIPAANGFTSGDLPEATCKALWKRDGRKFVFPYGLHPDDDVVNCPPAVNGKSGVPEKEGQ